MNSEYVLHSVAGHTSAVGLRCWALLSLLALTAMSAGCGQSEADGPESHPGHLVELPGHEHMQLKFAVDEKGRRLLVYVLNSGTHEPFAISSQKLETTFQVDEQNIPITLEADPRPDDPPGQSSRFAIGTDKLPETLYNVANFTANFDLKIDGETITGTLDHKDDHAHHHD